MSGFAAASRRPANGLLLLYEAAMLLQQQDCAAATDSKRLQTPVARDSSRVHQHRAASQLSVAKPLPPAASRNSHNELEKNRRAHLRRCLDALRDQLAPAAAEAARMTMLGVLNSAIAALRDLEKVSSQQKLRLRGEERRQKELMHRRVQLLRSLRVARGGRAAGGGGGGVKLLASARVSAVVQQEAWRARTVSEASVRSGDDTELTAIELKRQAAGRGNTCSSPDSGYGSPPACGSVPAR